MKRAGAENGTIRVVKFYSLQRTVLAAKMCSLRFVHLLSLTGLMMCLPTCILSDRIGFFEGGGIYWHANQTHPNVIQIYFRLHFKLDYNAYTHQQCSQEAILNGSPLITEGSFYVNYGEPDQKKMYAEYVCTNMDTRDNWATGTYKWHYDMPAGETTADIKYESCCWLGDINNNGMAVTNGKGWNLAAIINTTHGDGIVNTPPLSSSFPMYRIMKGCSYNLPIPHFDSNGDNVRCRWTVESKGECNSDDRDICGKIFYDSRKRRKVAQLDREECTLQFPSRLPAGVYAIPIILEDFSSSDPDTPLSKVPVQFLVNVFQSPGQCRLPILEVPSDVCLTILVGQEFQMQINAIATSSQYRITDIKVLGLASEVNGPHSVPGTDTTYSGTVRFTPTQRHTGKHSFCVMAVEENDFWSEQSCFTLDVIEHEIQREELGVLPGLSLPAQGSTAAPDHIEEWKIRFNRNVKKASSPALFRVTNPSGTVVYEVDTSGPDVLITGHTMTFLNGQNIFLMFDTVYTIHIDSGAVTSADNCNVLSTEAEWDVTTGSGYPGERDTQSECSTSHMTIYLPKFTYGIIDPGIMHLTDPKCTGREHNVTHYAISTGYGECGTSFSRNDTDVSFINVIYIPNVPYEPGSEITRHPHREVLAICHVPSNFINTLPFDPDVRIVQDIIEGEATLEHTQQTTLKMYRDRKYRRLIGPTEFPVDIQFGTKLFFQAEALGCRGDLGCGVFLESCWATVSENPFDSPRHTFIANGCPTEDTVIVQPSRGKTWRSRFSVDSFAFLGARIQDRVNVHCNIVVCDAGDSQSACSLGCQSPASETGMVYNDEADSSFNRDVISFASAPGMIRLRDE